MHICFIAILCFQRWDGRYLDLRCLIMQGGCCLFEVQCKKTVMESWWTSPELLKNMKAFLDSASKPQNKFFHRIFLPNVTGSNISCSVAYALINYPIYSKDGLRSCAYQLLARSVNVFHYRRSQIISRSVGNANRVVRTTRGDK